MLKDHTFERYLINYNSNNIHIKIIQTPIILFKFTNKNKCYQLFKIIIKLINKLILYIFILFI